MKRTPAAARALFVFLLLIIARGLAAPAGAPAARAAGNDPLPFYPYTLAEVQSGSSVGGIEWVQTNNNWVAYTLALVGCGHCNTYVADINLYSARDGRRTSIRSATWSTFSTSNSGPQGVRAVRFYWPYLVWTQPDPNPPQGYTYVPGAFACVVCYYDVRSAQGGAATALAALDPQGGNNVLPLDLNLDGTVLAITRNGDADKLWTVNLRTAETQQVTTVPEQANVQEGVLYDGNQAAWLEGTTLLTAGPNNPRRQLATGARRLHGTPFSLFWTGPDGVYSTAGGAPEPRRVAPTTGDYAAVDSSGGVGTAVAWADNVPNGPATLHVAGITGTPLLTRSVPGQVAHLSLDYGNLVYVAVQYPGDLPVSTVQLTWLVPPDPAFATVWSKADAAVAAGKVPRSWLWGPVPRFLGEEAYAQGSNNEHLVLYYDKSRMEVNNPSGNKNDPYYVTNGLLSVEMISGRIQIGDNATITASVPCTIPVAGDPRKDNPLTPSYAALALVASLHGDHQAPNRIGQAVGDALDVNGVISTDPAHAPLARYAAFAGQTGHNIPDVFWTYLQGMQGTYGFDWTFVLGYPITEGYWTQMRVGGKDYPVLIQAYQRRVLTYIPDFAPAWRVQQGNVGQHYLEWRYTLNR